MNVWPTNSGMSVQARAQVVIGSLIPCWFSLSTLPYSFASTYGPFLSERPICQLSAFGYFVINFCTPYRRLRRRRTIALLDALRRSRVMPPLALFPVGLTG